MSPRSGNALSEVGSASRLDGAPATRRRASSPPPQTGNSQKSRGSRRTALRSPNRAPPLRGDHRARAAKGKVTSYRAVATQEFDSPPTAPRRAGAQRGKSRKSVPRPKPSSRERHRTPPEGGGGCVGPPAAHAAAPAGRPSPPHQISPRAHGDGRRSCGACSGHPPPHRCVRSPRGDRVDVMAEDLQTG